MIEIGRWHKEWAHHRNRTWKYNRDPARRFLDFTSGGIFCCMFGPTWNGIYKVLRKTRPVHCYAHRFKHPAVDEYKEALRELTGFTSFVVYTSGTEAVEAFLRVAWAYTGKSGVWGGLIDPDQVGADKPVCDQFHGWTLGSRILAGRMTWHELGVYPELGMTRFGNAATSTACMAMEPYHAPSGQFHKVDPTINRLVTIRKEFPDVLFLIDEIQGGFGRTGRLIAYQHYADKENNYMLRPDFVTIGKLAGGGFPLAVLCGPSEILESEVVKEHAYLHSTHAANPLTCAIGSELIKDMLKHNLIERSHRMGKKLHSLLSKLPVRVHGKGLMAGIEMKDVAEADLVVQKCEEGGLLVVQTGRKWVKIGPCLTITEENIERGCEIVKKAVEEVVGERKSDAAPCGAPGEGPEKGDPGVEEPRFQVGVDRIAESSQVEGQEGTDGGTGSGPLAPPPVCGLV